MYKISVKNESGKETQIFCSRSDNVVAIKRHIRKAIYLNETEMQLIHGERVLNDNEYILFDSHYSKNLEYREIAKTDDIIINVARNTLKIPSLIQISRNDTISDLKDIIKDVSNIGNNIAIFDKNGNEFVDEQIIRDTELRNDSIVKICLDQDRSLTLIVSDFSESTESFEIKTEISGRIENVKNIIRGHLKRSDEISLFIGSCILKDGDRLIDYSLRNKDSLFYIPTDRAKDFEIVEKIKRGKFAKVFKAKHLNSTIILKRYNLKQEKSNYFPLFKSELIRLIKFENNDPEEFVKLKWKFQNLSHFYIGMDYMENGSLDRIIPLKPDEIIKYSIQVLNGLEFLHDANIVYRKLKCSSLLLNKTNNIKLCNFHLSKNLMDYDSQNAVEIPWDSKHIDDNWTAHEVLAGSRYDITADIWSIGAMLIEMLTGKPPYSELKPKEVRLKIMKTKSIEYNKHFNPSSHLDNVISLCLTPDPKLRPTVKKVKELISPSNPEGIIESGNN